MKKSIYIAGALIVSISSAAVARINFGSENAGIAVVDGTLLSFDFSSATPLRNGLLRDRSGNAIVATNGLACSNMTLDVLGEGDAEPHEVKVNGIVAPGSTITLGDDEKLTVRGGRVVESVVIAGSPDHASIIEGEGELYNTLSMENNSELIIRWNGQLNRDIAMTATEARDGSTPADTCYVRLHQDLEFAPGCFFVPSGNGDSSVNCVSNDTQYKLIMGGIPGESLEINHDFNVVNPYVRLTGPVIINNTKSLNIEGGYVEGAGNEIRFQAIYSFLNNTGEPITLDTILFSSATPNSFQGNGAWQFLNCRIMSNAYSWYVNEGLSLDLTAESFDFTGKLVSEYTDLFAGDAIFVETDSGSLELSLNSDIELYGSWRFNNQATIKGNGNTITCHTVEQEVGEGVVEVVKQGVFGLGSSDALRFENVTLANMKDVVFDTLLGGNKIDLCNVKWLHSDGNSIFVTGLHENAAELQLVAESSEIAGDIFSVDVTWLNSARIELESDIALSSIWTFNDDTVIDGKGGIFDIADAVFCVADGKTLTLRNMTLDGAKSALFGRPESYYGSINLSNVTIVLTDSTTWVSNISVTGPLTVVTGVLSLNAIGMEIVNGTAYYDTLDSADENNFSVDTGRVMHVGSGSGGGSDYNPHTTGTITVNGDESLDKNEYLFPDMEGPEGRIITCTGSGVLNGLGRTIVCPQTHGFGGGSGVVITVDAEQKLVTTNMVVDRLVPAEHLTVNGSLYFGHDTIVRLNQDIQLSDVLRFGSNDDAVVDEYMELDLG
ncbi:MAG: hypothetical protein WCJ17_02635, partial [bacterium]